MSRRRRGRAAFLSLVILLAVMGCGPARAPEPRDAPAAAPVPAPAPVPDARPPQTTATTPARDLAADERSGGHTLARHVGRSDADLRERLRRDRVSAASTYPDETTAARVVAAALARHRDRLDAWLARTGNRPNLVLDYRSPDGAVIGRSLRRGDREPVPCSDAVVVLRWDRTAGYYVLTSYPEAKDE